MPIERNSFTDHLVDLGYQRGYKKAVDDFCDKMLNFEDYIEPIGVTDITEDSTTLLYSGKEISETVVKIKSELKGE